MGAVEYLGVIPQGLGLLQGSFSWGEISKVPWKKFVCNNFASQKCVFIGWLKATARLSIVDRLSRYVQCDSCVACVSKIMKH